ncbi:MAG TPA: NUDIX hydrolase [Terracidiphilus sp.]|jgi:ADP-ribose pyrophosphatase
MAKKPKKLRSSDDSEANSEKIKRLKKKKKDATPKKAKTGRKVEGQAEVLSSQTVFEGPLFRVTRDKLIEPGGKEAMRDVVRHNGSAVILAIDNSKDKKDPWIVMERQYRHAARRFLWELPAGKLEPGEDPLEGAKRELEEETGYRAKKWTELVEYYASPGFLGESMMVFLAEGLLPGDSRPEEDELIEMRLVRMSELLKSIEKGEILDGKTLSSVLLYARFLGGKKRR